MMEIILNIICKILLQTTICSYLTISISKIFDNKDYSKLQIILTIIISLISAISCDLVKGLFPLSNTILGWIFWFINVKFILKLSYVKSIISVTTSFILTAITELIAMFIGINLFSMSSEEILNSNYEACIIIILQIILLIILTNIIKYILKNYSNIKTIIKDMNFKQSILIAIILFSCTIPQLIIFLFNRYSYSWYFIIINVIQILIICVVIFTYLKKSIEKEKAENDLITSELHNKTMAGMVDGVRTLKHDYNNIMQSLNGYVVTKQYDKLQEHINKVLKECNIVNTLSVIDPKIFNEPAIYGIVGAKYFSALGQDITMELDIVTNIAEIQFPMPELSRILGILLDNAIEATSKLEQDKQYIRLEMKFDNRKCADVIRVINTYDTSIDINLDEIYKKGVSSKKVKSGIG